MIYLKGPRERIISSRKEEFKKIPISPGQLITFFRLSGKRTTKTTTVISGISFKSGSVSVSDHPQLSSWGGRMSPRFHLWATTSIKNLGLADCGVYVRKPNALEQLLWILTVDGRWLHS